MAERKTQQTKASVKDFIAGISNSKRRQDAAIVARLMESKSEEPPSMWGASIVGFGVHRYKYANGKDAEICKIGFSPRAQSLVFYLANFEGRVELLKQLGKHKISGGGCLYINKLEDISMEVLGELIDKAYHHKGSAMC